MTDAAAAPPNPREGSVFVSYARADDLRPPNEDTTDGWVTFFWNNLRWELTNRGAKSAELWLDRYKIDPADAFTPVILNAVREARVIVPVFSENWTRSRWCREEVEAFMRTHDHTGELIVPVFKESVRREELPDVLQGEQAKEGYRFFEMDVSGETSEFYWRGLRNREAYNAIIRRIARVIITRLDVKPAEVAHLPAASGRTVFVAESANELRDARMRLVNDLTQAGHAVLPRLEDLPGDAEGYAGAIGAALGAADLAVFLLGSKHGDSPSGTEEPIIDLQLRLARAGGLHPPRVLWTPKWLPGQTATRRDPFEVAALFGGLGAGEEIFGEEITDLSQWLRERLAQKAAAPAPADGPAGGAILVTAAGADDDDLVFGLARLLQKLPRRVQPAASDEDIPDQPEAPVQVLLLWAAAGAGAIDARLDRMPAGASATVLILPGGDDRAKRRFFREGVVAETLPAPPETRAAALALLERLDLLPAGEA